MWGKIRGEGTSEFYNYLTSMWYTEWVLILSKHEHVFGCYLGRCCIGFSKQNDEQLQEINQLQPLGLCPPDPPSMHPSGPLDPPSMDPPSPPDSSSMHPSGPPDPSSMHPSGPPDLSSTCPSQFFSKRQICLYFTTILINNSLTYPCSHWFKTH